MWSFESVAQDGKRGEKPSRWVNEKRPMNGGKETGENVFHHILPFG